VYAENNTILEGEEMSLTMEEMNGMVTELRARKSAYDESNAVKKTYYDAYKAQEAMVIEALSEEGMSTYICDGVGRVTKVEKMAVRVPATPEQKTAFFNWLRENMGDDVATQYTSVNSQALNSLYNTLTEEYAARGEVLDIAGLETPVTRTELSFRKN